LRQRIIEALTYPRMLMTGHLADRDCPLNFYFDDQHESCRFCDTGEQCHWLNRNDEFSMLAKKPLDALIRTFEFSVDYVDAHVTRNNPNPRRCACDSCTWLRDARHLVREVKKKATRI
jgi:hypothetical protein